MKIIHLDNEISYSELEELPDVRLTAAIGIFDGIHLAHKQLLTKAPHGAVLTFSGIDKGKVITLLPERLSVFASLGIEYVIIYDFEEIKSLNPSEFVEKIISECKIDCTVCGEDFKFGKDARGSAQYLYSLMHSRGRECVIIPKMAVNNQVISSSYIKTLIEEGDIEAANKLMCAPYSLYETVVSGNQIGRTIGFPTINQNFPEQKIIPKSGVYKTFTILNGEKYLSITNVGSKPTINSDVKKINCETNILNCERNLYGQKIKVEFAKKIRDEKKFSSLDELQRTIASDRLAVQFNPRHI